MSFTTCNYHFDIKSWTWDIVGLHAANTKQCWTNVEDVGPTLYKCYTNISLFAGVVSCLLVFRFFAGFSYLMRYCGAGPANTKYLYNICTTTAQRLRRWSNNLQMLDKCLVFQKTLIENYWSRKNKYGVKWEENQWKVELLRAPKKEPFRVCVSREIKWNKMTGVLVHLCAP